MIVFCKQQEGAVSYVVGYAVVYNLRIAGKFQVDAIALFFDTVFSGDNIPRIPDMYTIAGWNILPGIADYLVVFNCATTDSRQVNWVCIIVEATIANEAVLAFFDADTCVIFSIALATIFNNQSIYGNVVCTDMYDVFFIFTVYDRRIVTDNIEWFVNFNRTLAISSTANT